MALVNPKLHSSSVSYERHRSEKTLLYKLVQENLYTFFAEAERSGQGGLPDFVKKEFSEFLKCGILAHGFLRAQCESCSHEKLVAFSCKRRGFCPSCGARRMAESAAHLVDEVLPHKPYRQWVISFPYQIRLLLAQRPKVMSEVLGIINRAVETQLIKKAGLTKKSGARSGAVTFVQRFGGSINLNIHFHQIYLDGVYTFEDGKAQFHTVDPPSSKEMEKLVRQIANRVIKLLLKRGLIEQDDSGENYLPSPSGVFDQIQGSSITYRVAFGPRKGQKVLTLQSVPAKDNPPKDKYLAKSSGFSLHAGVSAKADERKKLERICRYISRPSFSEDRLSLNAKGHVVYKLKKAYDNGTTHIVMDPVEFIARLASLVPRPRVNLTRFSGVFAPHFKHRKLVVPRPIESQQGQDQKEVSEADKARGMRWAQGLRRVFQIDVEKCPECDGKVRIIASIEDPKVITKILDHLGLDSQSPKPFPPRGPPTLLESTEADKVFEVQSFPEYE